MATIKFSVTFYSDWHCGSGLSAGADSDTQAKKTRGGLPVVPGKTIKGLLKDAARDLYECDPKSEEYKKYREFIDSCFGKPSDDNESEVEYNFHYSKAVATKKLATYFKENPGSKENLYRNIDSTSINTKTGVAKNRSLRTIEVTQPFSLAGTISDISDEHREKMVECLKMIKRLGTNRNRGLGRCEFKELEEKGGQQ